MLDEIGFVDKDGDGFRDYLDCDDGNISINPAQPERWNQIDDNCNGYIDEGLSPPEEPPEEAHRAKDHQPDKEHL